MAKKADAEKRPPVIKGKGRGAKRGTSGNEPPPEQLDAPPAIPPHLIRPKG